MLKCASADHWGQRDRMWVVMSTVAVCVRPFLDVLFFACAFLETVFRILLGASTASFRGLVFLTASCVSFLSSSSHCPITVCT